jgi:hypothetical protein
LIHDACPKLNDSADVIDVPEDEAHDLADEETQTDRVEEPGPIRYAQQQQEQVRLRSRLADIQRIGHFPKTAKQKQAEREELQRRARDAEERADEARAEAAGTRKEA